MAIPGFGNCGSQFTEHPKVIDGASQLAIAIFGDDGRHPRTAVGCVSLPLAAAVEISLGRGRLKPDSRFFDGPPLPGEGTSARKPRAAIPIWE